jgi:hypothetical protein
MALIDTVRACTVLEAAPSLEQHVRKLYGDAGFEHLRELNNRASQEATANQLSQVSGMLVFLGTSDDEVVRAMCLLWFVKNTCTEDLACALIERIRTRTVADLLAEAAVFARACSR